MHTGSQPMRFFLWILIGLSLALGLGVYLKFQGKNEGQAAATLNASQVNVQSTNLIGYWTFDGADTSSTTATDRGGANNGTITEAVGKPGKIGQALDFDGGNDKVAMGDVLDRGDTDDLTLAGWFRRDTSDTDDTIIAKRNGVADTDDGYILYIDDATDQLIFEVSEIGGSDEYQLASTSTFTTTDWYHFIVVWDQDSAGNSEIYINGADDNATDTGTIGDIGDLTTALAFTVGEETDNGNSLDGRLDDIRVYSNAFSTTQVADLYGVANSAKIINAGQDDMLTNGLVGYWTFDGNDIDWDDANEIKDVSGNGNHGNASGSLATTSVRIGKLGQGLSFNGTDETGVLTVGVQDNMDTFTWCAWINANSLINEDSDTYIHIMGKGSWYVRFDNSGVLRFVMETNDSNSTRYSSVNLSTGSWIHLCGIFYGIGTLSKIFMNGSDVSTSGYQGSGIKISDSPYELALGAITDNTYYANFVGKLDDVRIYNRALSPTEIVDLYNLGK